MRRARGFTLLEAIVAMVLISTVALSVFGWINANLLALNRIHDTNARSEATVNVLEYMRTVNPMLAPGGKAQLGAYRIEWNSEPLTDAVDRGLGYYQYALYRTRVDVARDPGARWFDISVQLVGYRRVRSPPSDG